MSEDKEFLQEYDSSAYEKPSVAVDLLIFTIDEDELKIVLTRRGEQPFCNMLSLPGVFVGIDEALEEAVKRGLKKKVGVSGLYFEQLYTWGAPERDPRMRIIAVSYLALVPIQKLSALKQGEEKSSRLYSVKKLLEGREALAFDHRKMIECGRERIKNKVEYTPIAFQFLPQQFTLPQLQKIYEILLDRQLYKANFRKKIMPMVQETGKLTSGDAHRPSKLYERRTENE